MTLDGYLKLVNFVESLSEKDYQALCDVVLKKITAGELYPKPPQKSPPGEDLKDCDPGTKRQGAAPKIL